MKKTLYLVRHGQTLFNLRKKIQGWSDSPLTEVGIMQAQIVAQYFKNNNIKFDHAYSSTQERASDTLELIVDIPYERLKGLKERNFGIFEGESEDLNPPLPYNDYFKTFGGEGEMELRNRITTTLKAIMGREDHQTVLAVSHGAICAAFYRQWEPYSHVIKKEGFHNCCILKFEYEKDIFMLAEIINHDYSHLKGDD